MRHNCSYIITYLIKAVVDSARDQAIPTSPSGTYAPTRLPCPRNLLVRQPTVQGPLSAGETDYLATKAAKSIPLWRDYLSQVGLLDFDIDRFLGFTGPGRPALTLPNFGFAISGGGARAGLVGAGILNGFDLRNEEAKKAKTGGLLQLANYAVGLSGGSWLLGSWATSNFPTFTSLNKTVWRLTEPEAIYKLHTMKQIDRDLKTASQKSQAGFETSIVDAWAQLIIDHTINTTEHANAVLLSSVQNLTGYTSHYAPFIVVTATSRPGGKGDMTLENPVYEFTPLEFGTWHPSLNAFIPIDYLGTSFFQGRRLAGEECVVGFDSMGNIFSVSSSTEGQPFLLALFHKFLNMLTGNVFDEAIIPNPFRGLGLSFGLGSAYPGAEDEDLYLADSSLSGETLPMWPLIQPARKLDVIIAVDSSNRAKPSLNLHVYPNGSSLYNSYAKTLAPEYKAYNFPRIPNPFTGEFTRLGYHQRPVFFGCNQLNASLIIYLPNHFVVASTDAPTTQIQFRHTEIDNYFTNGFAIATQASEPTQKLSDALEDELARAGPSSSVEWSVCLACALIDRQQTRNGLSRTGQCQSCFEFYCSVP
ncbi:hypothetical protein CROQUDRAFT_669776 [Cronartium quercuum f. sp. fusiforme G11]|uniref:Lysophospholipase n=1 Tax=Cronartium quercuum f. sp. fusiforme G11 TaxID=708437 RepID=A0A9P6TDS6_9BASI|nr:hypothetical protein CROQUDRAFT_669776 [Cronartium quercuum f. sp. fusiforme G11]